MIIGNFNTDKEIMIIAEIGNNHEGSYALAEKMIGLAAKAGTHAVKFQTIIPEKLISTTQPERIQQLKKFQLSSDEFVRLSKVAQQEGVLFLSTPFDLNSVHFLNSVVPAFKIASGDINFFPMIELIAQTGKPILFSTGASNFDEIVNTRDFIRKKWEDFNIEQELAILHCVSSYPTPPQHANLAAIKQLQKLDVTIGYSDHTQGIEAAVVSVALGARIIEKHFTIDKKYSDFHDHQLSADPNDMRQLVQRVKEVEILLGHGDKRVLECEKEAQNKVRRSIAASHDLKKGMILSSEDIMWVRPGLDLSLGEENKIIGKSLLRDIPAGNPILTKDLQ